MFDPFDSSGIQRAYRGTRFTSGEQAGRDTAARAGDEFLRGAMDIDAAETSARNMIRAAERASRYTEEQARRAQQAAQPSGLRTGLDVAGGIIGMALPFL